VWIEIEKPLQRNQAHEMSLPSGEVWIEISSALPHPRPAPSLPSGEVWIEILFHHPKYI